MCVYLSRPGVSVCAVNLMGTFILGCMRVVSVEAMIHTDGRIIVFKTENLSNV